MPRKIELTWISNARKWRKRYRGKDWYFPTHRKCERKKDVEGYRAAFEEWRRVEAWLNGETPCPYANGNTGRNRVLLPSAQQQPTPASNGRQIVASNATPAATVHPAPMFTGATAATVEPTPLVQSDSFPGCVGVGLGAFSDASIEPPNAEPTETRISKLIAEYLNRRQIEVSAGELSIGQWGLDSKYLEMFQNFLMRHYADCSHVVNITARVLSQYKQNVLNTTKAGWTRKKKLATIAKWLKWLCAENYLQTPPKSLDDYASVKIENPTKRFFTVEEVKALYKAANEPMKLFILLAMNTGATQTEIATLTAEMVNWQSGILERPRNKTGELTRAKLWPVTLRMLHQQRSKNGDPLLATPNGGPLFVHRVTESGKYSKTDSIGSAFTRLRKRLNISASFKCLRKTSGQFIEDNAPELTPLFLSHAQTGMKKFYVNQNFERLFGITDQMREHFGFPAK